MTVRTQHQIDLFETLFLFRTDRITHDPGIDENRLSGWSFNVERRVSQPSDFVAFEIDQDGLLRNGFRLPASSDRQALPRMRSQRIAK
jgi:hypothetical protein